MRHVSRIRSLIFMVTLLLLSSVNSGQPTQQVGEKASSDVEYVPFNPFEGIRLKRYTQYYKPPGFRRRVPGFGWFEASGSVSSRVRRRIFIRFSSHLSQKVRRKWIRASAVQKGHVRGWEALGPPLCTSLLLGTGSKLSFKFISEARPHNPSATPGPAGLKLLAKSHSEQANRQFPEAFQLTSDVEQSLSAELENPDMRVLDQYLGLGIGVQHQDAKAMKDFMLSGTGHNKQHECPECQLLAKAADQHWDHELKGSWILTFGSVQGRDGGAWNPQPACAGVGRQHGCQDLLKDNGVVDLYDDAQAMILRLSRPGLAEVKRDLDTHGADSVEERSDAARQSLTKRTLL